MRLGKAEGSEPFQAFDGDPISVMGLLWTMVARIESVILYMWSIVYPDEAC